MQIVDVPGKAQLLSASATATVDGKTWLFASASRGGTTAWTFGADHMLKEAWSVKDGGNSPFYAGGLLYIYDSPRGQSSGHLLVLDASTGKTVATLDCGGGHWNSAIVVDNRIALPEGALPGFIFGNRGGAAADSGIPAGIVNIWHLP